MPKHHVKKFRPVRPVPEIVLPYEVSGDTRPLDHAVDTLCRDGILVIKGAFSKLTVKAAIRDFSRALTHCSPDPFGHSQFGGMADSAAFRNSRSLSLMAVDSSVANTVQGYLGRTARWTYARGYRIEPISARRYRAFQPHIDGHLHELKAMVLLTSTTVDQQCMLYWRGTHRFDWCVQRSSDTVFGEEFVKHLPHPVPAVGVPGDIILFDTNGIHMGQRNLSTRRDALVFSFAATDFSYPVPRLHPAVEAILGPREREFFRCAPRPLARTQTRSCRSPIFEALSQEPAKILAERLCALALQDRLDRLTTTGDMDYLAGRTVEEAIHHAAHSDLNLPQHLSDISLIVSRDRAIGTVRDLRHWPPNVTFPTADTVRNRPTVAEAIAQLGRRFSAKLEPDAIDLGNLFADLSLCIQEALHRTYLLNSLALCIIAVAHDSNLRQTEAALLSELNGAFSRVLKGAVDW